MGLSKVRIQYFPKNYVKEHLWTMSAQTHSTSQILVSIDLLVQVLQSSIHSFDLVAYQCDPDSDLNLQLHFSLVASCSYIDFSAAFEFV